MIMILEVFVYFSSAIYVLVYPCMYSYPQSWVIAGKLVMEISRVEAESGAQFECLSLINILKLA